MIPFNPGNLLKFNRQAVWQRHQQPGQDRHPFGLKCPTARLLPFQLYVAAGISAVTWKIVSPLDSGTFTAMDAADLTIETADTGGAWVTWYGISDLTIAPACGFWEIWVEIDGIEYYSEVVHAWDQNETELTWRMRLGHNTDKDLVLYQSVYQHYFYPTKWAWDRPEVDRDLDIVVDGNGSETTRFSRTVAKYRIEIADMPDYVIPFFRKCGDLDNISFEDAVEGYSVTMGNVVFESRPQDIDLNVGIFTFDAEIEAFNDCQDNYTLV